MARRPTILIVEDDADLRGLFQMALSLAGFEVREASDGYEALRALDRETPDLVVLDLMLPQLSGRIVRDELAAHAHTRSVPVVVVTGVHGIEVDQIDADCVLTKPVLPDELVAAVRKCLHAARRNDEGGQNPEIPR